MRSYFVMLRITNTYNIYEAKPHKLIPNFKTTSLFAKQ